MDIVINTESYKRQKLIRTGCEYGKLRQIIKQNPEASTAVQKLASNLL
jgi:ribosomal protein L18E